MRRATFFCLRDWWAEWGQTRDPHVSWDYSTVSVQKTLRSFDETVGKIESCKFSNKGVKMCKATCDNCDLRYFCHFK